MLGFACTVQLCLALVSQVLYFSESLVPTARKALCDPLEEVREAAAKTFEQLHSTIGHQALEDILPFLLKQLVSGSPTHLPVWPLLSVTVKPGVGAGDCKTAGIWALQGRGATGSDVALCLSLNSNKCGRQGGEWGRHPSREAVGASSTVLPMLLCRTTRRCQTLPWMV